jgi:hypothetical protein
VNVAPQLNDTSTYLRRNSTLFEKLRRSYQSERGLRTVCGVALQTLHPFESRQRANVRRERCDGRVAQSLHRAHRLQTTPNATHPTLQRDGSPIMANRVHPHRTMPTTLPADKPAACNDWHFSDADSMSARDIDAPTSRCRDIRLQVFPQQPNHRSTSCFSGGVHIRGVRPQRAHVSYSPLSQGSKNAM